MAQRAAIFDRATKLREDYRRLKERALSEAAPGWDALPGSTARVTAHLWNTIKNENWCIAVSAMPWSRSLWPATQYYNFIGSSGGSGQGYGSPAAVGAALANRDKGIVTVSIEGDGDLMYAPGSLWTAAHHKIPLLMIVHNNRAYHQEVMHLQKMASLHNRRMATAAQGPTVEKSKMYFAQLAQASGPFA